MNTGNYSYNGFIMLLIKEMTPNDHHSRSNELVYSANCSSQN